MRNAPHSHHGAYLPFLTLWGSHTHEVGKGGGEDAKPTKGSHKVLWYTQKMWKVKKRRSPYLTLLGERKGGKITGEGGKHSYLNLFQPFLTNLVRDPRII